MTASSRVNHLAQASPKSQRSRTAANASVDSDTSKRTSRATRTSIRSAGLETNGLEDGDAVDSPGKRKKIEAVPSKEVPAPQPGGVTPKKTGQPREVKQETEEDIEEQEPSAGEKSTSAKRRRRVEGSQEPVNHQVDRGTPKTIKRKRVVKVEEAEVQVGEPSPKKTKRRKATEAEVDETFKDEASPSKSKRNTKVEEEDEEVQEGEESPKKIKRKRKTKEERELEAMPLAVRTDGLRMFIGAHVSGAKGWLFWMYIASVELRLVSESRCSQLNHQLRAHWVIKPPSLMKRT